MKMEMIVLGYETVDFYTDEQERIAFTKIHALTDKLESDGSGGFKTAQYKLFDMDSTQVNQFAKEYPAKVNAEMSLTSDGKGKPVVRLDRFNYVKPIELFDTVK